MKICSFCKRNLSNEKFRKIKRKNWEGFYPSCKICKSISMKDRYEKILFLKCYLMPKLELNKKILILT